MPRSRTANLTLSEDEVNFAKALAHYGRGLIYENEVGCKSDEALEHFTAAMELDPARHELYARAALIYLRQNRPHEAIKILEKACRNNPRNVQAWVDLGVAYEATDQFDKAIEQYWKALKLDPEMASIYVELANIYFRQDKDSEALKILKKGLRKANKPDIILAFCYNCGVRYVTTKQIARAIPCFEIIAHHDPSKTQQFYELLGELYASLGYKEEAVRHFILATKSDPPKPDPFLKLAALYMKTDPTRAIETLNRAAEAIPNDPTILFSLGLMNSYEKQFEKAIDAFQQAEKALEESDTKTEKLSAIFYLHYGAAYERSGQIEKAEEIFEKCLKTYPETHQILNYLAYMWAEKGVKLEKALEYVTRALQLDPENGAYIDTLGWIYYKQKKYNEALEQIQTANELIKNDATIIDHLGDIFDALENREKAISYWKQSFMLEPENETTAGKLETHGINPDELRKEAGKDEGRSEAPAGLRKTLQPDKQPHF